MVCKGGTMTKTNKQPSQTRAINTRKSIIDAAARSFLKNGYKKTNTILIAKDAKVSVGIVYSYFEDKDELLELWLNSLLERCDDYFYNQFKLKEYEVELPMIISNILEKLSEKFFSSPIVEERSCPYVIETLDTFFDKAEKIFIRSCYDAEIFVRNQNETAHLIFHLLKDYNKDLKSPSLHLNPETLKSKYVTAITALLS